MVVAAGLATGFAIVGSLKPVAGLQLYDVAPLAVSVVLLPAQIVVVPVTVTVGVVTTVTVAVAVEEQPVVVPVTVYVVVADGVAVGFATVALLNPVVGNQLYVVAPLAFSAVEVPEQIVPVPLAVTAGDGFTVTVTVVVPEQPPDVPVTV